MASKNSQDAISMVQTAEGALQETHAILQRMRELATQSASDTNETTVDRAALDAEFQQLTSEIDDIANKTKFNDMALLDGSFGVAVDTNVANSTIFAVAGVTSVSAGGVALDTYTFAEALGDLTVTRGSDSKAIVLTGGAPAAGAGSVNVSEFGISIKLSTGYVAGTLNGSIIQMGAGSGGQIQTGSNEGDNLSITITSAKAQTLAINTSAVDTRAHAETAITDVNAAINTISSQRATLGAIQNRLSHKINNLDTSAENLQAAESRIRDIDMAKEMTTFTKNNILSQASTAMLAQANSAPQGVLKLLQ
jgi:flagellin